MSQPLIKKNIYIYKNGEKKTKAYSNNFMSMSTKLKLKQYAK